MRTPPDDVEASLGAAMLAAYGVGLIDAAQVRRGWIAPAPRAAPDPASHAAYARLFDSYIALYPALRPVMHALRRPAR